MMKHKSFITVIILIIVCSIPSYAQDGSLKIDLDISTNEEQHETTYIEQQDDLMKLFYPSITDKISRHQQQQKTQQQSFIKNIFLQQPHHSNKKDIEQLFINTKIFRHTEQIGIVLKEQPIMITWKDMFLLILGFSIMILSIIKILKRKKMNN